MKSNAARLEVIKAAAERRRQMNYERTGMLSLDVLPDEPIPAGSYLVHNHVRPQKPLGRNGATVPMRRQPVVGFLADATGNLLGEAAWN